MSTYSARPADVEQKWFVVDAEGVVLGRLASEVAKIIRGKHKPTWAPHVDGGDHVIIVNASKIAISPKKGRDKLETRKYDPVVRKHVVFKEQKMK